MQIDPIILVPGAAAAVLLMILYIRLVIGRREALLEEEKVSAFLRLQAPELTLDHMVLSDDRKSALVIWRQKDLIGVVRSFGNKYVLQTLPRSALTTREDGSVHVPRQGLTHPALDFRSSQTAPWPLAHSGAP